MEERINELEENIKKWREELDTVWKGKDTDAAEVERRNLRNLINNAQREINQLKGIETPEEGQEVSQSPEELLEELKNGKENDEKEKRRLNLSIERLEEEKEAYESQKNTAYKDIYKEYEDKIKGMKEELEKLEKKEIEGKDEKIKILTQGRMKEEAGIREIEKKIRQKEQEIADIEYGTEEAMEEKELSDGTKTKVPKVLNKYNELDELRKSLKERTEKKDEYQKYINELKGIEKEERPEYTAQQNAEYTKYFHGQGDIPENTRDDKRANDEYFGFEKPRDGKKPIEPVGKEPGGKTPTPPGPGEKDPKGKDPKGKDSEGKDPEGKKPGEKDPAEKKLPKIQVIEINEKDGSIFFKDASGKTGNLDVEHAFSNKENLMKKLKISEKCKEIAGGNIRGFLLKRKLNPEVLMVLDKYPEQCEGYIKSIKNGEKNDFDIVHNLEGASFFDKFRLNKHVRAERKSGELVLGSLLGKQVSDGLRQKAKALVEGSRETVKSRKKDNEWLEKVENKDNHIEKKAIERIEQESQEKRAKEVQSMMEK